MSDIFISYASEDRAQAERLARTLEVQGRSVWWDRNILPGRSFDEVIKREIDAAKCIVVLWSSASVVSDWVKEEAAEGKRRRILIPALIENVGTPFGFGRLQTARLADWDGRANDPELARLLDSVERTLDGAESVASPDSAKQGNESQSGSESVGGQQSVGTARTPQGDGPTRLPATPQPAKRSRPNRRIAVALSTAASTGAGFTVAMFVSAINGYQGGAAPLAAVAGLVPFVLGLSVTYLAVMSPRSGRTWMRVFAGGATLVVFIPAGFASSRLIHQVTYSDVSSALAMSLIWVVGLAAAVAVMRRLR